MLYFCLEVFVELSHGFCSFVFLRMVCWIKGCNMDSALEGTMNVEFVAPNATHTSALSPLLLPLKESQLGFMLLWLS